MYQARVITGIEGIVVGVVGGRKDKRAMGMVALALLCGIAVLVGGYYFFEASIYPQLAKSVPFYGVTDAKAALAEIGPNLPVLRYAVRSWS